MKTGFYSQGVGGMTIARIVASIIVFLGVFINEAYAVDVDKGVVFVHGTRDHRVDAEGGYWKEDFLDQVRNQLPNPDNLYVVHCDFLQYMWHEDAAGCVAEQIQWFVKEKHLKQVSVYSHSDGANVVRWILSNPTYDERFFEVANYIDQVIAIAPSSGGTPLADEVMNGGILEAGLGWLLGYRSDSVKQQQVGDMAIFNEEVLLGTENRPSLIKPFYVIVGTDVTASPMNSASYCNGYFLNSALKVTKIYLDYCADGFLNCESQLAAGQLWFYDYQKTENATTLSHNQSRHNCFGLDKIVIPALLTGVKS
jgi:hypothetical protein